MTRSVLPDWSPPVESALREDRSSRYPLQLLTPNTKNRIHSQFGNLAIRIGLGWAKSLHFHTGQTPVMKYHRGLMMAILHEKVQIAKAVNINVISLDEAPNGYRDFDHGAAKKFVLDPHGMLSA